MGARFSASQSAAASSCSDLASAKVITPEGHVREYTGGQSTAAVATADCSSSSESSPAFLCDADTLFCDEPVRRMSADDPLLPGRFYFLLPEQMLHHPLCEADMGALAARATAALQAASGGKRGTGRGAKKSTSSKPSSKSGGKCRVAPLFPLEDVANDGEKDLSNNGRHPGRTPGSSPLKIHRPPAAVQSRGRPAGNKRRVGRDVSCRLKLGTIPEAAAE